MDNTETMSGTIITAVKDHVFCELDSETVILNSKKGMYYGLNEVGGAVWTYIQEPRTFEQIVEMVHGKYEGDIEQMKDDVDRLLQGMAAASLIQVQYGGNS